MLLLGKILNYGTTGVGGLIKAYTKVG